MPKKMRTVSSVPTKSSATTYVVLDLETTGLKPDRDQIIDFAAIKLRAGKEIGRLASLINPGINIPSLVTIITGISDAEVAQAPAWPDRKTEIAAFLADSIVVGHNIEFDLQFLRANGIDLSSEQTLDTLDLASLLLPKQTSYSLEILCQELGLTCQPSHRALPDSEATVKLFQLLQDRLAALPPDLLDQLAALCQHVAWPGKTLIEEARQHCSKQRPLRTQPTSTSKPRRPMKTKTRIVPLGLTEPDWTKIWEPKGPLARHFTNYQSRPSQQQLAAIVWQTLTTATSALIEAGIGTGRNLATLLPAILWAQQNQQKVVVATHSPELASALQQETLPLLKKVWTAFTPEQPPLHHAQLKHPSHYLCLVRWAAWQNKPRWSKTDLLFALKITLWLAQTTTGDRQEIHLTPFEYDLWPKIAASNLCQSHPDCFFTTAHEEAKTADLIVTSHSLVIEDALCPSHILPPYETLLLFEAHRFEQTATAGFGQQVTLERLLTENDYLKDQLASLPLPPQASLFAEENQKSIIPTTEVNTLIASLENLHGKWEILFGLLGMLVERHRQRWQGYRAQISITTDIRTSDLWQKIVGSAQSCEALAREICQHLIALQNQLAQADTLTTEQILWLTNFNRYGNHLNNACQTINSALRLDESVITWLYLDDKGSVCLHTAPLQIAPLLKEHLYRGKRSVIFLSSTLTIKGNFSYFASQVGAEPSWLRADLPSPFDYKYTALLVIPQNLPHPAAATAQKQLAEIIFNTLTAVGGQSLVLFTSYNSLETVYNLIAAPLKGLGLTLLGQGISGGRGKIVKTFSQQPEKHSILATGNFWEGLDIPDKSLHCVIINKLPFDNPDDPIIKARSALFANAFQEYALPRAVLKFRQGFDRLIRSEKDHGIMVLLDKRLETADYRHLFLDSLPEISIVQPATSELKTTIERFLGKMAKPD